jgi:hypothetical protein
MTLALNGTNVTGTHLPQTIDLGGGLIGLFSGTITGSASGANVNLTFQNTMTVRGFGDALTCRGGDSFAGQLSGNTLNGTFSSGTTPYMCDGGIPLPTPQISGPMTYTKQ